MHVVKDRRMNLQEGLRGGLVLTGGGAAMSGLANAPRRDGLRARRRRCDYIGPRGILTIPAT